MRQRVQIKVLAVHGDMLVVRIPAVQAKPLSLPTSVVKGLAIRTGTEFVATVELAARSVAELNVTDPEIGQAAPAGVLLAVLHCPWCGVRHVDEGNWLLRPHYLHLCVECGKTWRVEPYAAGKPVVDETPPALASEVAKALVPAGHWVGDRDCAMSVIDGAMEALLNPGEMDPGEHARVHETVPSGAPVCEGAVHAMMVGLEKRSRATRRSRILAIAGRLANWLSQVEPTTGE